MMRANFSDHFLVTFDTPVSANVIPVDEALLALVRLGVSQPRGEGPENEFSRDIHYLLMVIHTNLFNISQSTQPITPYSHIPHPILLYY